jgi:hypothetical protein
VPNTVNRTDTSTTSGDVASTGAQTQTGLNNSQQAGIVTGGGSAPVAAANVDEASIVERGVATGQTGLSAAEGSTAEMAVAGRVDATNVSQTDATSGGATATGLTAQNSVTNSAQAGVLVNGQNQAAIGLTSSNNVNITDVGTSAAASGQALAKGGAASLTAGATLDNGQVAGAGATPGAVGPGTQTLTQTESYSALGATGQNVLRDTQTANVTLPGGPASAGTPVSVLVDQTAMVSTTGYAGAGSAGACAGAGCSGAAAGTAAGTTAPAGTASGAAPSTVSVTNQSVTQAGSGDAQAQGLNAQNTVNTSVNADVRVGGSNYGVINVVVETVTNVVNWGKAVAGTGTASATGGAASTDMQGQSGGSGAAGTQTNATQAKATSGNVDATGGKVTNQVDLTSDTTVRVAGDNYSPIEIVVKMTVDLYNAAIGRVVSGDARANGQAATVAGSGAGGGAVTNSSTTQAVSGTAKATGLDVQNTVNLAANVLVDIAGNNYGRITIRLLLITNIYNEGQAEAFSGNATAIGAPATTSLSGAGPATGDGPPPVVIRASASSGGAAASGSGGGGTAAGNGGAVSAAGAQSVTGSGSTVRTTTGTGSVNTVASNASASSAQSGNGEGVGLNSVIVANSSQFVGVSAPGASEAKGSNTTTINVDTAGYARITTGDAMTQPTPTPLPTPVPEATRTWLRPTATPIVRPNGLYFTVNPWDEFGNQGFRWRMPDQRLLLRRADGTYYEVDPWGNRRSVQGLEVPDGGVPAQLKPAGDDSADVRWLPINARVSLPGMPDMAGRGGPETSADAPLEASDAAPAGPAGSEGESASQSTSAQLERTSPGSGQSWWSRTASLLAILLGLLTALVGYRNRSAIGAAAVAGVLRARLGMAALSAALIMLPIRARFGLAALGAALVTLPVRLRLAPAALLAVLVAASTRTRLALASLLAVLVAMLITFPSWWRK